MPISDRVVSRRRLSKLADFLQVLPRKRFDYGSWCTPDEDKPKSCGTTACAWGWAPAVPGFRRLGVRPSSKEGPTFDSQYGFAAAARFFRINWEDAYELFNPGDGEWSATPKQVAKKIRKWVKENLL